MIVTRSRPRTTGSGLATAVALGLFVEQEIARRHRPTEVAVSSVTMRVIRRMEGPPEKLGGTRPNTTGRRSRDAAASGLRRRGVCYSVIPSRDRDPRGGEIGRA